MPGHVARFLSSSFSMKLFSKTPDDCSGLKPRSRPTLAARTHVLQEAIKGETHPMRVRPAGDALRVPSCRDLIRGRALCPGRGSYGLREFPMAAAVGTN